MSVTVYPIFQYFPVNERSTLCWTAPWRCMQRCRRVHDSMVWLGQTG